MKTFIFKTITWLFAIQFIVFGLNKFLGFVNPPPPTDATAMTFLGAMFGSYLAKFVGLFEIIGALLLLVNRTRFIGLLILFPIMLNIIAFHLVHDNPGNGIWLLVTVLFILEIYEQRINFIQLFKIKN